MVVFYTEGFWWPKGDNISNKIFIDSKYIVQNNHKNRKISLHHNNANIRYHLQMELYHNYKSMKYHPDINDVIVLTLPNVITTNYTFVKILTIYDFFCLFTWSEKVNIFVNLHKVSLILISKLYHKYCEFCLTKSTVIIFMDRGNILSPCGSGSINWTLQNQFEAPLFTHGSLYAAIYILYYCYLWGKWYYYQFLSALKFLKYTITKVNFSIIL